MDKADLTNRYAVSLYVDLRLGILGGKVLQPEEAQTKTAQVYGRDAASYARRVAN